MMFRELAGAALDKYREVRSQWYRRGLSPDDIADIALKRMAIVTARKSASTPAQGALLEILRRESPDRTPNEILEQALLASKQKRDILLNAAIVAHNKYGGPVEIDDAAVCRNIFLSFEVAKLAVVLTDEQLITVADTNYEMYRSVQGGRVTQKVLFRRYVEVQLKK